MPDDEQLLERLRSLAAAVPLEAISDAANRIEELERELDKWTRLAESNPRVKGEDDD